MKQSLSKQAKTRGSNQMQIVENVITKAPKPNRGYMRLVYEALEDGPMTRQQIRRAVKGEDKTVDSALSNLRTRGYVVHGAHNHRFAVAPLSHYESRTSARSSGDAPRKKHGSSFVRVQLKPAELAHIDAEVQRRKLKGEKGATRTAVVKTAIRSYFRRPTKKQQQKQNQAKSAWWKFWGGA